MRMSGKRKFIPVGTAPGQTRCSVGDSGLVSYGMVRSPHSPRAGTDVGGRGSPGYQTLATDFQLRNCLVVLTRLSPGQSGERMRSTLGTDQIGSTSLARDSPSTGQPVITPGGDLRQVPPRMRQGGVLWSGDSVAASRFLLCLVWRIGRHMDVGAKAFCNPSFKSVC